MKAKTILQFVWQEILGARWKIFALFLAWWILSPLYMYVYDLVYQVRQPGDWLYMVYAKATDERSKLFLAYLMTYTGGVLTCIFFLIVFYHGLSLIRKIILEQRRETSGKSS